MIYSVSSVEFSEFRIWIQVRIWIQPILYKNHWRKKFKHLKFNQKEEFTNYLPFSISKYSSTVHTVQNSPA